MHVIVHGADIQDRDGGAWLMATLFGAFPFLLKLFADGDYQGPEFQAAMKRTMAQVNVEIVKRSDGAKGFVVLPRRWVRKDFRVAQPMSPIGERLGVSRTKDPPHSCGSPRSGSCCESYVFKYNARGQTLSDSRLRSSGKQVLD
jgi:hypothetical protein